MLHKSAMNNRDLICSGHKVGQSYMSADDLAWAAKSAVIQQDVNGNWYHTLITDRDRKVRDSFWQPDTGPFIKGVNC